MVPERERLALALRRGGARARRYAYFNSSMGNLTADVVFCLFINTGPILSMETNASGSLLTAASDASFARWPDSEPFLRRARFGSSGTHSSKGATTHGRHRERAGGSNHGGAAFASFSGSNNSGKRSRHFEFGGGGGGAAWTPTRMHHRVDSPRVCAIDPSGAGRMVTGTRDGVVTCASLD